MNTVSFAMSVFTFLFGSGCLITFYKNLKSIQLGLQAILRDRLLQAYKYYKEAGSITYQEMNNLLNMYNMYHSLGANGVMDEIVEDIKNIPIKG